MTSDANAKGPEPAEPMSAVEIFQERAAAAMIKAALIVEMAMKSAAADSTIPTSTILVQQQLAAAFQIASALWEIAALLEQRGMKE